MSEEKAEIIIYLKRDIETVRIQLKRLKGHSFGFGTAYYDIDDFLRPLAEAYLKSKLKVLENELKGY